MKKKITAIIVLIIMMMAVTVWVSAVESSLSGALDIIAADTVMIRSAQIGENVSFSERDFEMCLGEIPHQIKIMSLPKETEGTLYLGNTEVFEGQSISRANFPLLVFVPYENIKASSFEFSALGNYNIRCDMKLTEEENASPVISNSSVSAVITQSDITSFGKLSGYDPDHDELTFEVTEYPGKGILSITNAHTGTYTYTPYAGVVGKDSFTYRVKDCFGNYSDECMIEMNVSERNTDIVLADMEGHWAHNAALTVVSDGAMDIIYEMDKVYFDPDETLTREEFLKAVMISLGCPELPDTATIFADDNDISDGYGGYVSAAYKLGIIEGTVAANGRYFEPHSEITRAEGAVILNRILGVKSDEAVPVLSDFDLIPTWAEGDMQALFSAGIISGNGSSLCPLSTLTRAETAQMIFSAKNIYS